ncbi:MAG: UbiX family flavin prenyltransferase [Neisseriaceae bacterium]|nr:MAG: UbiX family flavin prenyltransferase [Neisseriaceae bacterium]
MTRKKILIAMTGASGAPYTKKLLQFLINTPHQIYFVYSKAAQIVAKQELNWSLSENLENSKLFLKENFQSPLVNLTLVGIEDWFSCVASGSNTVDSMLICPCSMGTLSAIAHGLSDNLIERAADVVLKENKQLILVPREMPFSNIHLENMLKLSQIGVEIIPPIPGFYHKPTKIEDLIDFVVIRILKHIGITIPQALQWGE